MKMIVEQKHHQGAETVARCEAGPEPYATLEDEFTEPRGRQELINDRHLGVQQFPKHYLFFKPHVPRMGTFSLLGGFNRVVAIMEGINNFKTPNKLSEKRKSGYRAFTEASDGSMCLAMEYGGEKSLNDLIEERYKNSQGPFPAAIILKVALNMARGLKYLHQEKKLLHGDIKSSNVVIKGDFETIKICDVGVSLSLDENMTVTDPEACYIGTEPWKPKEALQENGIITDKADIFAFGLTLWEMMTLSIPHINLNLTDDDDDDEDKTFDESDFDDEAYYAALGTRPPVNMEELDESYQRVLELFSVCTNEDPKARPSATHIVEALELDGQ
ncbi:Lymphokine-activated killer T-cell-originated protein kinase [Fukomys damarensis]|uniref:Lymphokine-activated killer T-cell-originated protein kinase n=1 Tax=Fukomys damarensis TaxID=885580 RepID=A0A091EQR6_FUKDA|nr:Lymphokine-activated killer T-cell-originated protein kinase [Fukomys damarensis]